MHLFLACAEKLDWARLVRRFGPHWRVLLAHLCLFGFMYPSERNRIPAWIMAGLMGRLDHEMRTQPPTERVTQGTLVSREQYLVDLAGVGLQGCAAHRGQRDDARRHRPVDAGDRRQQVTAR